MNKEKFSKVINWIEELYPNKFSKTIKFEWFNTSVGILHANFIETKYPSFWNELKWNYSKHTIERLESECYIGELNCLLVFDELYKFTTYRKKTLEGYLNINLGFNIKQYIKICEEHKNIADEYQKQRGRTDFNFEGGAQAKRALKDVMLDLKPVFYGLNPTIRISEIELNDISSKDELLKLILNKINCSIN